MVTMTSKIKIKAVFNYGMGRICKTKLHLLTLKTPKKYLLFFEKKLTEPKNKFFKHFLD